MRHILSSSEHWHWGLPVQSYPKLYTQDAIAAHFRTSLEGNINWRSSAISTISDICKLVQPTRRQSSVGPSASHITISMLKNVLELTRFPSEFQNFSLPSLVAGSILLMSSVEPTPFSYEYGYLCFRILVFSLNTCLIDYGYNLEFTIERMSSAPPGTHLNFFWVGTADLIAGELSPSILGFEKRLTHVLDPNRDQLPILEGPMLDILLNLLHKDQKNFLAALMTADSLQVSGVLFILYKYLESERRVRGESDYNQKLFCPYSQIFRRYRLVFPEIEHENQVLVTISLSLPGMHKVQDNKIVDQEDLRNIICSYNRCLESPQTTSCKDVGHHMGFVTSLFAPGCDNLVPSMINSSFRALWNTWSKTDGDTAANVAEAFGIYFWQIFNDHMKLSRSSSESWRSELVDAIMRSDILELIFQVALKLSDSQRRNTEQITRDRIKKLFDSMIIFWEKAVAYTPEEYFEQKLIESGSIDSWFRYLTDFTERLYTRAPSGLDSILLPFSMLFSRAMTAVLGMKWRNMEFGFQVKGTCDYPRCPYPTNASTGCSRCVNATYCGPRCSAKDWSRHKLFCVRE
ncbi:unnamed protein product [Rhizoctonia solani]|uniref:MYND-type domain-containing protein n=1 Tax=Rhizoctonia solani TaxID=456999 RepID=A0A8H2WKL7_9AGAM|nr:unnamed protein product [Rhizoctonia solani]